MDNKDIFLIVFLLDFFITFITLLFFARRSYLLNRMATQRNQLYASSFMIKLSFLSVFAVASIVELILSQTDTDFWLAEFRELALILIFPILTVLSQLYIINLEHKKK